MEFDPLNDGISTLKLIDVMPAIVPDGQTADYVIVQSARVSYGQGTKSVQDDETLLRYLMRHQHMTPFEMAEMKFLVIAPLFVARQWVRHRTACVSGNCNVTIRTGDTYINMPIEKIMINRYLIGSEICSYNESTKTVAWYKLNDIWPTGDKSVMQLTTANLSTVSATTDHKFYVRRQGVPAWRKVADIKLGDELLTIADDCQRTEWSAVRRFDNIGFTSTYELEVSGEYHGFYCGNILIHNSINEYSARYSVVPDKFYKPAHAHIQSANNKQGSGEEASDAVQSAFDNAWQKSADLYNDYNDLLIHGIAREEARMILPASAYTQFYWKCDLRNILHFLELRVDKHAQFEIRKFAEAMLECVKKIFPKTYKAFDDYCLNKVVLHGAEVAAIMNRTYRIPGRRENEEFQQKISKLGLIDDSTITFTAEEAAAVANRSFQIVGDNTAFEIKLKKLGLLPLEK